MAQIKILVKDITGTPIKGVSVVFNLGHIGLIEKISTEEGIALISGLEVGDIPITISKDGYTSQSFSLHIENEEQNIAKEIILIVQANINMVVAGEKTSIIEAFKFVEPKNIDEAKKWYKELEKNVATQKDVIDKALKNGVYDIVQQQASNLTYTLGQQLTESIHWYVEERSKLNPLGSLKDLKTWSTYTAMVGGLYFLRSNLVEFLNKLLEKIGQKI